jgi:hypothetical protein
MAMGVMGVVRMLGSSWRVLLQNLERQSWWRLSHVALAMALAMRRRLGKVSQELLEKSRGVSLILRNMVEGVGCVQSCVGIGWAVLLIRVLAAMLLGVLLLIAARVASRLGGSQVGRLRRKVVGTRGLSQSGLLLVALARLGAVQQVEQIRARIGRGRTVAKGLLRVRLLGLLGLFRLVGAAHKGGQETSRVSRRRRRLVNLSRERALDDTSTLLSMLLELVELMELMVRQLLVHLLGRTRFLRLLLRLLGLLLLDVSLGSIVSSLALQLRAT